MEKPNSLNLSLLDTLSLDIIMGLPLDALLSIADLEEGETRVLELTLGGYIRYRLDRLNEAGYQELTEACLSASGKEYLDDIEKVSVIAKDIWKKVQKAPSLGAIE